MEVVADDEPLSESVLLAYQSCGRAWVAVDDSDRPIGYVVADILDGNAHIEQLSVLPANMRKGLGRALIEHLAAWASRQGMAAVTLTTFVDVPWNRPHYHRLGFETLTEEEMGRSFESDATTRRVAASTGGRESACAANFVS